MKASFNTTLASLEAAVQRAGLQIDPKKSPSFFALEENSIFIETLTRNEGGLRVDIYGPTHHIMRVIGALADDGQDCLISAA